MKEIKDLSKATNVKKYFSQLLLELKNSKVKGVYSRLPSFFTCDRYECMCDEPIYILFENGKCLAIDYCFIDNLDVEYRAMTEEEQKCYEKAPIADYFNCVHKIHDGITYKLKEINEVRLPYGKIIDVRLKPVKGEYNKWTNHRLGVAQANEETFNEIEFVMDNGKSFFIFAGDAEIDGYAFFYSDDAFCSIEEV